MSECNLLGHIIAKFGIKVDLDKVWTIMQIPHLVHNNAMQCFLGKINFLRKFIFHYAQIIKPIQEMIKSDIVYKWDKMVKDVFTYIKQEIAEARALQSLDFSKYFFLYTFTYDTSLAIVLTQKDQLNNERPIFFMNVTYKDQRSTTLPWTGKLMQY